MTAKLRITLLRLGVLSLLLAGSACSKPEPPKKDEPPKPRAEAQHDTELRDAIQAPIDRAKAVEPAVLDAAEKQRADIDAQMGG